MASDLPYKKTSDSQAIQVKENDIESEFLHKHEGLKYTLRADIKDRAWLLSDLMAPLDLGWKTRTQAELALMSDLHPLLAKRAAGREISGLRAYES